MLNDEYKHLKKRLRLTQDYLADYLYDRVTDCRLEFVREKEGCFWPPPEKGWQPIRPGERWGSAWEYAWFRIICDWPNSASGKMPVLNLKLGGEGLVYTEDGKPMIAISRQSIYSSDKKHFVPLHRKVSARRLVFYARVVGSFYNGLQISPGGDMPRRAPMNYTQFDAKVIEANIGVMNEEVRLYLQLLKCYDGMFLSLDKGGAPGFRLRRIAGIVRDSLNCYAEDLSNIPAAIRILKEELSRPAEEWQPTAHCVGHAHLDVGWLWPVSEGVQKAVRTFSEQLTNIRRNPDYVFGASQAYLYEQVKAFAPSVFKGIQRAVKAGQWEIQGGTYVEMDSNCAGGESLVRQFLYAKEFFQKEFGVDVRTVWLPDSFGFSAVLPQIARSAGCDSMVTSKPFWAAVQNKENCVKMPYSTFAWYGLRDCLLVNILPMCYYNGVLYPDLLNTCAENCTENDIINDFLVTFGIGDGGGGPKEEHIEEGRLVFNTSGVPKVKFAPSTDAIERQMLKLSELPRWDGEIYLEMHRGTLTNIAGIKKLNRRLELRLKSMELLNVLLGGGIPQEQIECWWKVLLLNQFHDILPGSSIPLVYERAFREMSAAMKEMDEAVLALVKKSTERAPSGTHLLFNPTSVARRELVEVNGRQALCEVEPYGCVTMKESEMTLCPKLGRRVMGRTAVLENDKVRYEFDRNGRLTSAFMKETRTELVGERPGNLLACYVDKPNMYDGWDIDSEYEHITPILPKVKQITSFSNECCQELRFSYAWGKSTAEQRVRLVMGSARLDFVTSVDWHETHRMLRVDFPLALSFSQVRCDLDYGFINRPAHRNTESERNQFEFSCQRFIAAGEGMQRVALLNDCKYGAKARENSFGLNLLRSARYPNEVTDRGMHHFTYSFLPYSGVRGDAEVLEEAIALNQPLLDFPGCKGVIRMPVETLEIPGVTLEAVKFAQDGSGNMILRLVEHFGQASSGVIAFAKGGQLQENNVLEQKIRSLGKGRKFTLEFAPFEIKTLRMKW